jgi:hypothetical protein
MVMEEEFPHEELDKQTEPEQKECRSEELFAGESGSPEQDCDPATRKRVDEKGSDQHEPELGQPGGKADHGWLLVGSRLIVQLAPGLGFERVAWTAAVEISSPRKYLGLSFGSF